MNYRPYVLPILCALILLPMHAFAARLYFDGSANVPANGTVPISIMLDTEGQTVNAVTGTVVATGPVHIVGIQEKDSVIPLWIEEPSVAGNTVAFSGVITGGFSGVLSPFWSGGHPGKILTVLVSSSGSGEGRLSIAPDAAVLSNDGSGTALPLTASDLLLHAGVHGIGLAATQDTEPPAAFVPQISRVPEVYSGAYFVAFQTSDDGSGIDHYEVAESAYPREASLHYVRATSPYQLTDQHLRSYIYVKAMDRAGNERVAMLAPRAPRFWQMHPWLVIIGVAILAILSFFLLRARFSP